MDVQEVLGYTDRSYRHNAVVDVSRLSMEKRLKLEAKIPELIEYLLDFRKYFDARQTNVPNYPVGFCKNITDSAFENLRTEECIKTMQKDGLIFKRIWGIYKGVFQNAMQLGHLFVNVAGDTVNPETVSSRVVRLEDSGFKQIQTYEDYLTTARDYWKFDAVPNYVFPFISPANPFIFTCEDEAFFFTQHQGPLLSKDIRANFTDAESTVRRLSGKTLTRQQLECLVNNIQPEVQNLYKNHPETQEYLSFYFEPRAPEEMERMFGIAKQLWKTDESTPGRMYMMTHGIFKNKLFKLL